jgi:secreted trypsin-like serine protease
MKKYLLISLIVFFSYSAVAQKVNIQISRSEEASFSLWQIVDENYQGVFSGNGHYSEDTVSFSLEAEKFFFLQVTMPETTKVDSVTYSLLINGEPVLRVAETMVPGDYFFKFFTGVRKPVSKITGGTNASIVDFPWQVYMIAGGYRCGATIIAPGWILTAAHCTETDNGVPIPSSQMSVVVGAENPGSGTQGKTYRVSEAIVHENYNGATLENDIAVLKLNSAIDYPNATPIKIVTASDISEGATSPGVMSWVTGWGLTNVSPNVFPTKLQKVQLPIVSNSQASVVWSSIPSSDLMAGYLNGNKDACNGDSGGPLVVPVLDEYKLAGIVSWGSTACNTYGAYTRVSLFTDWIKSKTGIVIFSPATPTGETVVCSPAITYTYKVADVPSASYYEWKLYPANAGSIVWNTVEASATWNQGYTGKVSVMVRASVNDVVSDWSKLDVIVPPEMKLISQSGDTTLCTGNPLTLQASAEGYNPVYKWYRNNTLIQSGTSNVLDFPSPVPGNSGVYNCIVTSACGSLTSKNINITILPLTSVKNITPDTEVGFGKDAVLEVNPEGDKLTFQWNKDGADVANGTDSLLYLYSVDARDIGIYKVTLKGTCGTLTSDSIYVYVKRSNQGADKKVFVWPTVTSNEINIAPDNDAYYTIRLFNTAGQLMKEVTHCMFQTTLSVSHLPRDVYILKVFNKDYSMTFKVIKQ